MRNKNLPVVAKMIPARMGKGPSFQVVNMSKDQRDRVVIAMGTAEVKEALPFLQGDQADWVMVEFWNHDAEVVEKYGKILADSINVTITPGDQFTREELGLI